MISFMQALYAQRNIAANAQRKYILSYTVVKQDKDEGEYDESGLRSGGKGRRKSERLTIVPSTPIELKNVLLYAPSPSGRAFQCSFHNLQHKISRMLAILLHCCWQHLQQPPLVQGQAPGLPHT